MRINLLPKILIHLLCSVKTKLTNVHIKRKIKHCVKKLETDTKSTEIKKCTSVIYPIKLTSLLNR